MSRSRSVVPIIAFSCFIAMGCGNGAPLTLQGTQANPASPSPAVPATSGLKVVPSAVEALTPSTFMVTITLTKAAGVSLAFGDGTTLSLGELPPGTSDLSVSHTYAAPGRYTITVDVVDNGVTASVTAPVFVR